MAKKRTTTPLLGKAVTLERAARLYRLLKLLDSGPKTRKAILQRLAIDIRTFYRDLELLRECEIAVLLEKRKYILDGKSKDAIPKLPFPDPNLSLGDAIVLAKGRSQVHQKLKRFLKDIMG